MIHQIATTIEQSRRLIACGVDPNTADMYLSINVCPGENYGKYSTRVLGEDLITLSEILRSIDYEPSWSLSALLELLPKHLDDFPLTKWRPPFIEDEIWEMDNEGVLNGDVQLYSNGTNWTVDYDWDGFSGMLPQSENPIEAVVLAIELLTANGYKWSGI